MAYFVEDTNSVAQQKDSTSLIMSILILTNKEKLDLV